jgi:membrane protein DedA with SNARE-associated domain
MDLAGLLPQIDVSHLLRVWGYLAVGLVVGLESIGLPLPGETTLLAAAVLAGADHDLHIVPVIAAAAAGATIGDNIGYWIGRYLGLPLVFRYGRRLGLGEAEITVGRYLFQRHGGQVVFFGRFVAVLRALAALLAGINQMAWRRFLVFNATGAVLWAGVYGTIGYVLGNVASHVSGYLHIAGLAGAVVAIVVGYLLSRRHYGLLRDAAERAFPGPLLPPGPRGAGTGGGESR